MVRFSVDVFEDVCKSCLSDKENDLKIIYSPKGNFLINPTAESIEHLEREIAAFRLSIDACEKALALSKIALTLGAQYIEDEE